MVKSEKQTKKRPRPTRALVPLRSGFYALPIEKADWIYARLHHSGNEVSTEDGTRLFVTGLPYGATEDSIKKSFEALGSVDKMEMLPVASSSSSTLLGKELAATEVEGNTVDPLFIPSEVPRRPREFAVSAILTFSTRPKFPPSTSLSLPPLIPSSVPSFLAQSIARHKLARPGLSAIIAHTGSWMSNYDQRKLSSMPAQYAPPQTLSSLSKTQQRKVAKQNAKDAGPLPGSAAYALQEHAKRQREAQDRNKNPDEIQEGEWTTVTRGGRHGKSVIPSDAKATVSGYGGTSVGVARTAKAKKGVEDEKEEAGPKVIVGKGFYRFTKEEGRRADLAKLKRQFEDDKQRVRQFREDRAGKKARPRTKHEGRNERSYKPY